MNVIQKVPAGRTEFELKVRLLLVQDELAIAVLETRLSELQERVATEIDNVPTNPEVEYGKGKDIL